MLNPHFFTNSQKIKLAYLQNIPNETNSSSLGIVFLSGYRSDMQGTKANFLANLAETHHFDFLRLDYSGHGESEGDFKELTLSDWINDAKEIIEHVYGAEKPLILIGSSMGAWIAISLFEKLKNPILNFIALAPAPDFSDKLMHTQREQPDFKAQMEKQGYVQTKCDYEGEDFIITQKFLLDADKNAVLNQSIPFEGKVHILQGMQDNEVPYEHAILLSKKIMSDDITIELRKSSDHRLSSEEDLERLEGIVLKLIKQNH